MTVWSSLGPEARIELVRKNWKPGASAADIATAVSLDIKEKVSRNAIIGYYTRKPERFADKPLGGGNMPKGKREKAKVNASKVLALPKAHIRKPVRIVRSAPQKLGPKEPTFEVDRAQRSAIVIALDEARREHAKPLLEIGSNQCRWVVSTSPYLYCAAECEGAYCVEHRNLMYEPPRQRLTIR